MHLKRWVFLVHRWLGVLMCALFAMWFVSGVVMMYVGYPKLTPAERLQHLAPLGAAHSLLEPQEALHRAGVPGPLKDLRLARSRAGQAVYLASPLAAKGADAAQARPRKRAALEPVVVIDAQTGAVLSDVNEAVALASAAEFGKVSEGIAIPPIYVGQIQEDAFTHSRALDAHRPLHLVQLGDTAQTHLYVSGKTGEVVRDAPRWERYWNYLGAWIHWLYPFRGNGFDPYWTDIVNWLSIVGIVVTLLGTWVGILRWRFSGRYKSGSQSPYRGTMMRWHHISGLLFALITLTWIFSGLMSMNPWHVFDHSGPRLRADSVSGGNFALPADTAPVARLLESAGTSTRELRWTQHLGQTVVYVSRLSASVDVLDSHSADVYRPDQAALKAGIGQLMPSPVAELQVLSDFDLYYYAREPHTMGGGGDKPLPIWRVKFADNRQTWVHVDPRTGRVLGNLDQLARVKRWLFAMLHSWDWLPLLNNRPLWDLLLIILSLGGTVLSVTSCVIGWRRLRKKLT